jgi:C4-dicarboxylate-specific signal transduction histidine kinase
MILLTRGKVEISVKDNGNGIPQKKLDKIFQPFFTIIPIAPDSYRDKSRK